jgi:hypothetical protein
MSRRPDTHGEARSLQSLWDAIRKTRLEVDELVDGMETRAVHGIAGAQALVEDSAEHLDESAPETRAACCTQLHH